MAGSALCVGAKGIGTVQQIMPPAIEKVRHQLERYEQPLFEFSAREKGEAVEVIINFRNKELGLHTYYLEIHPRDPKRHIYVVSRHIDGVSHPQFPWSFQRQLYDCVHDYIIEMFTRTPQIK